MSGWLRITTEGEVEFESENGVTWTTGTAPLGPGRAYRWFRAKGRRERRYDLREGEAGDESLAALRAQLRAATEQ